MKTAMKKLFSLMLVAVLLVGVMPFQASADGVPYYQVIQTDVTPYNYVASIGFEGEGPYTVNSLFSSYSSTYELVECTLNGNPISVDQEFTVANGDVLLMLVNAKPEPTPCAICGNAAHDGVCCGLCNVVGHAATDHCTVCGQLDHTTACPGHPDYVDPTPATVLIRAKAPSDAGYPDGGSFEVTAGSYTVIELYNKAGYSDDTVSSYCVTDVNGGNKSYPGETMDLTAGSQYILWIELKETTVAPTPDTDPTACTVCGADLLNGMCTGCYLDMVDCACSQTSTPEDTEGQVDLILNYNYKGAKNTTVKVARDAKIVDLIAGIPAPTRDGHQFSHWTMDAAGEDLIDDERVTDRGTVIYAQWDDDLAVGGKLTVRVNLNYDRKMGEDLTNIKKGTKMSDVLDYVTEPTRWNHKFVGWYWDKDCDDDVDPDDRVYEDCTIYAKWERRKTNNEIMLKVYLNGNTKSVAKIVDMYAYSKDGKISISEVKDAVKKYYTAKDSDGLEFSGLFEADDWSEYVSDRKHTKGSKYIEVNEDDDTTIYVMVSNAKVITSSSGTADSSNPKTGDMIFNAVTVMSASVTCLAVLFFLNKKRAF